MSDMEARVTALEAQVAVLKSVVERLEARIDELTSTKRPKPIRVSLDDQISRSLPTTPIKRRLKPPRGPMID